MKYSNPSSVCQSKSFHLCLMSQYNEEIKTDVG